ncbi:staygreen family protein [Heyndrickxia sporothermodurans]
MNNFKGFSTKIIPPATILNPLQNRKYLLTHCETSGEWLLSIGTNFTDEKTLPSNIFHVIQAQWTTRMGEYVLLGKIAFDMNECVDSLTKVRYMIYQKDLPNLMALIIEADKDFFSYHPLLLDAPIHIEYKSTIPDFYQTLYLGTPRKFLTKESVMT